MSDILFRRLTYMLSPQTDIYRHLAAHLKDKQVLEVGFGTGFGVLQYAGAAKLVTALDPDNGAVEFARTSIPLANVVWLNGDILKLWMPERFDAVVMIEVLEHIEPWMQALENAYTYLKPGGALYLSARNANAELRKNDLHAREWNAAQLVAALKRFFPTVELYDYALRVPQTVNTHQTPLLAVARK